MTTRIVSFLGIGNKSRPEPYYDEATYSLDQVTARKVCFNEVATVRAAAGPVTLVFVGTKEARLTFFDARRLFEKHAGPHLEGMELRLAFREIAAGNSSEELWTLFNALTELLSGDALTLSDPYDPNKPLVESASPSDIWLDVTRGWRNQPFFAASAVTFVRAQERREKREAPPARRILYAAYDLETKEAPFRDLTAFLEAADWNRALDGLMRFGRADDLEALLAERERGLRAVPGVDHKLVPKLKHLGSLARSFADALATGRVQPLLTSIAPAFARSLSDLEPLLAVHAPPVAPQVAQLRDWAQRLSAETVISGEGLSATLELLELYGQLERYAEQAALLRERMIDEWTLCQLPHDAVLQPGSRVAKFNEQRHRMDAGLGRLGSGAPGIGRRFQNTVQVRNDVEHCGYNHDPLDAQKARKQLKSHVEGLPTVFLNLSNHPSAGWSDEQRHAALALGCRSLEDLPFPGVPPEADEAELATLAAATLEAAMEHKPAAAMVAGEPGLVALLVAGLQARGVRCYTATTRREAVEALQADGTVRKTSTFRFVRWRAYPPITLAQSPAAPQEDAPRE